MPLSAGDKLGPYEVIAAIGAGGMGEVYKARDTRLDRTVAIKVLPDHIAKRDDLRARFEREARTVASLNHPNICTLYDIGPGYMVMELIEGESLAARIEKGAIPLDQALQFATQIADALDRAHRAGVTHRDVKPQNIMITRDGVKVLDFGLAKSAAKPGPTEETLTAVLTTEGTIMGTPQYMAPEQFEGREADARGDIWAFGAVLYEMLTGRKAFEGKSYSSLVGAILATEPTPMNVKPWLERLVGRCLRKEPEDRYHCMRDLVLDLKSPPEEIAPVPAATNRWPWAIAAVATIAGVIGVGLWLRSGAPPVPRLARLEIAVPSSRAIGRFLSLSPDGKTLAWADGVNVYLRDMDGSEPRVLTAAMIDGYIVWSPDSKHLAFRSSGILKRISVSGGPLQTICEARTMLGAAWMNDDTLLLGSTNDGMLRVSASGGTPERVKVNGAVSDTVWMTYPTLLPGGKKLMFATQGAQRPAAVVAGELQSDGSIKVIKELVAGRSAATYITDAGGQGQLLFIRGVSLMAQPFDPESLVLSGEPQVIVDAVGMHLTRTFVAAANGGTIVFRNDNAEGTRPEFVDRSGTTTPVRTVPGTPRTMTLSPDGRGILTSVGNGDGAQTIWILDPERGAHTRVSFGDRPASHPIWSPDGRKVAYLSEGLWIKAVQGTGNPEQVAKGGYPWSWSHDGKKLIVSVLGRSGFHILPLDGDRIPTPYLESKFLFEQAQFSPDDRWVAYSSDEAGQTEVYVRRFPDTGEQIRISNSGGMQPRWRRDGRELFYVETGSGKLMSVPLRYGKTLEADVPVPLFDARIPSFGTYSAARYDVTPDGKRFIVARDPETERTEPLRVILNWRGAGK